MKDIAFFSKIYLASSPVDFRKQAHGLALIAQHSFGFDRLNEKTLFAFTNRSRTSVKILYWDGTGLALWWKTLEKDRFAWPSGSDDTIHVDAKQLRWLLDGIDIGKLKRHEKIVLE